MQPYAESMSVEFRTHKSELGATIRRIRESKGLPTRKFSEMVGMSRRNLALIESGSISPKVTMLERIAAGLETSVSQLTDFKTDGDSYL